MNKTFKTITAFSITEAGRLSGLTTTMLDYLCRQDVLVPGASVRRGRGRARRYSFGDVVILRVVARLLEAGVSVRRLKKALIAIRRLHSGITPTALPAPYLVTDGVRIYLRDGDGLVDLDGSGQMSFLFVIRLADVRQEIIRASKRA